MTDKTIVILLQENSTSCGDVNEFDEARDAEKYIEGLLEAGFERQNIRVMEAHGLNLAITPRPIVSLHAVTAPAVEPSPHEDRVDVVSASASDAPSVEPPIEMSAPEPQWERAPGPEAPEAEPYTRNGVRFSSAFSTER